MSKHTKRWPIIVVGAGNAALCAAIAAKEQGQDVLVLERAPKEKRGGNSFFTDGAIRTAYGDLSSLQAVLPAMTETEYAQIDVPIYGETEFMNDLNRVTEGKSEPILAKQLVSKSFETLKWMKSHGVEFELNENQYYEENGMKQFWGGLPLKTSNKGIGLIHALLKRAEALGITISYDSRLTDLTKTKAGSFQLTIDQKQQPIQLEAGAVILACGGFEANKQKRVKHIGSEWEHAVVRGTEFNTGDGLELAIKLGAAPYGQWDGCHAHTTDYNAPRTGDFEKPGDIYKKSSYPLGLIVNEDGKRFVDEGADFRNYTYAKYGKETLKQPNQKAFQLFDSQVSPNLRKEYKLEEATMYKADSIEELAHLMELNPATFKQTIDSYNAAVQPGPYNPAIKDGKRTKELEPPKSNWALRFEKAPFYAYPVTCGITFTFGGIKASANAEVLQEDNQRIPGLFAAGEMIGGLFYHNYPGGSGLMSGAVFGKLAGEAAGHYAHAWQLTSI
ncbi:FAD-dependent tricarballylate dehydrogenase TcuA [Bacillus sp. JCM 19041]|uniref:FAD-dependent tricarballylate dehydrogenase TcuA n=1 Tax=Bacillus sp. JCM 19041 TaxID=1460637 RepID=UPI0006D2A7BC